MMPEPVNLHKFRYLIFARFQKTKVYLFEHVNGAPEKTRTSTIVRLLAPEASASTNSATGAYFDGQKDFFLKHKKSFVCGDF